MKESIQRGLPQAFQVAVFGGPLGCESVARSCGVGGKHRLVRRMESGSRDLGEKIGVETRRLGSWTRRWVLDVAF